MVRGIITVIQNTEEQSDAPPAVIRLMSMRVTHCQKAAGKVIPTVSIKELYHVHADTAVRSMQTIV